MVLTKPIMTATMACLVFIIVPTSSLSSTISSSSLMSSLSYSVAVRRIFRPISSPSFLPTSAIFSSSATSTTTVLQTKMKQRNYGITNIRSKPADIGRSSAQRVASGLKRMIDYEQKKYSAQHLHQNNFPHPTWDDDDRHKLEEAVEKLTLTHCGGKYAAEAGALLLSLGVIRLGSLSVKVRERMVGATALVGIFQVSLPLFSSLFGDNGKCKARLPSVVCYMTLLSALRKRGMIQSMRTVLVDLGKGAKSIRTVDESEVAGYGVDVSALNVLLVALCEAASREGKSKYQQTNLQEGEEKQCLSLMQEALYLLLPGKAASCYGIVKDPDLQSFNTVLHGAASVGAKDIFNQILRLMDEAGVKGDTYTSNARLRVAGAVVTELTDKKIVDSESLSIVDELLESDDTSAKKRTSPDAYTVEMAAVPLARAGRVTELITMIRVWLLSKGQVDVIHPDKTSNAFSAILHSLSKAGQVDVAETILEEFVLVGIGVSLGTGIPMRSSLPLVQPIARHFNALLEGYKKFLPRSIDEAPNNAKLSSNKRALHVLDTMVSASVTPDAYTVTLLMGLISLPTSSSLSSSSHLTSNDVAHIWKRTIIDLGAPATSAVHRATITAYGKAQDPSSAIYSFDRMIETDGGYDGSIMSWNALLSTLSRADPNERIDALSSIAASADMHKEGKHTYDLRSNKIGTSYTLTRDNVQDKNTIVLVPPQAGFFSSALSGMTPARAVMALLQMLDHDYELVLSQPLPDQRTYLHILTTLAKTDKDGGGGGECALNLLRAANKSNIPPDGRILNAAIRCFGKDLDKALIAWKNFLRFEALRADANIQGRQRQKNGIEKQDLISAYRGMLYVAGRAQRPETALQMVYAMNKEGIEPTEVELNCYRKGLSLRAMLEGDNGTSRNWKSVQYEDLLSVECLRYDQNDKRRSSEKRIRIIF